MATKTELHRKVIGVPLEKSYQRTEDGFLLVRGKFTSDARDEVGDIITRFATERAMPKYRRWGNIRRMHAPDPVGKVTRIGVEDGLDWNEVEIKVIDPKAIFEVENGLLQALSVGALVNMNSVELLADGGWIINDYSLAEISLVDHPANYDASLALNLSLDSATRTLARQQGLTTTLRSMGIAIEGEKSMEPTETPVEKDLEQPVGETLAETSRGIEGEPTPEITPVGETPVVDAEPEQPVAEEAVPAEEVVPAEEEAPAEEQSPTEEPAPVAEDKSMEPALTIFATAMSTMAKSMEAIMHSVTAVMEQQKAILAKGQVAPDQPGGEASETAEALHSKIASLEARVIELSTPVNREGALPTEELPELEEGVPEHAPALKAVGLRDAVKRFTESKIK